MNKNLLFIFSFFIVISYSCERFETEKTVVREKKSYREITVSATGDSIYLFYSSEGYLKSKSTYRGGLKNGVAYNYYKDGTAQNEIHYYNNIKHGIALWYYESGNLYRETPYKGGVKDGIQKIYFEKGNPKAEIPYADNKVVLGTKEFKQSGKLITNYPKIVVSPINKLKEEMKYYLRFRLSPEKKKVKFYLLENKGRGDFSISLDYCTKDGVATFPMIIYPGESVMKKIKIRAVIKTKMGNPMVLQRTYNLAVENR